MLLVLFLLILYPPVNYAETCFPANCSRIVNPEDNLKNRKSSNCNIGFMECKETERNTQEIYVNITGSANWYLYRDFSKQFDVIALNVSWSVQNDDTSMSLSGFELAISNQISDIQSYAVRFCMNVSDQYLFPADFNFNCYGLHCSNRISPSDSFHVSIAPLPYTYTSFQRTLSFAVNVPSCEDELMGNVEYCFYSQNSHLHFVQLLCHNQTIVCNYSLPFVNHKEIEFGVCDVDLFPLSCQIVGITSQNQGLMLIPLPDVFVGQQNLSVILLGPHGISLKKQFTQQDCARFSKTHLVVFVVATVVLLFGISFILFFILRQYFNTELNLQPHNRSIYLLFVPDTQFHQQVVLQFADFLHRGLGFSVIFHLWDQEKVCNDHVLWMEQALKAAQNVIFVWSPQATKVYSGCSESHSEMFLPVFKQAQEKMFLKENQQKYHVVSLPYHKVTLPEFGNSKLHLFKLMKDFNELCFTLTGKKLNFSRTYTKVESGRMLKKLLYESRHVTERQQDCNREEESGEDVSLMVPTILV